MFDLFGTASRARAEELQKSLDHERARVKELENKLLALTDLRAHAAVNPRPRREEGQIHTKSGMKSPNVQQPPEMSMQPYLDTLNTKN